MMAQRHISPTLEGLIPVLRLYIDTGTKVKVRRTNRLWELIRS